MSHKKTKPISPTARWINTRVEYQWDKELEQYVEVSTEGYWYDGPMALAHNQANTNQVAYRIYASDNSTAIAAQNTSASGIQADTPYVCRILWENTGDLAEDTQTYQLQYQNVTQATGWQNVTGASTHVRTADASGLTNGTAVTAATLTGQTAGTFANGEEVEDGLSASVALATSSYTEYWFAFQILSADANNNDNIQLRIVGSTVGLLDAYTNTPDMTASVATPTVVTLTPQALTVTPNTLTVAQNFPLAVTLAQQNLTVTPNTLTVIENKRTTVDLTAQALTVTPNTLDLNLATGITPAQQDLTVTPNTLTVLASVNTIVDLTPQALAVTPNTLAVSQNFPLSVDLTAQALTVTPNTLTVTENKRTTVDLTSQALTVTPATMPLVIGNNVTVDLTAQALTVTPNTLTVDSGPDNVPLFVTIHAQPIILQKGRLMVRNYIKPYSALAIRLI